MRRGPDWFSGRTNEEYTETEERATTEWSGVADAEDGMADGLRIGLFSLNTGVCAVPEGAARVGRAAEAAGFESLWVGEHVVLPDPRVPPSPMNPQDPILDPVV